MLWVIALLYAFFAHGGHAGQPVAPRHFTQVSIVAPADTGGGSPIQSDDTGGGSPIQSDDTGGGSPIVP